MDNKKMVDELCKIGKLPSDRDDVEGYPINEFGNFMKQIQLPLDFETVVKLINLSPPVDTGCFGMEWTIVHLVEKYEKYDEYFEKIMEKCEDNEIKRMLIKRNENYIENNNLKK